MQSLTLNSLVSLPISSSIHLCIKAILATLSRFLCLWYTLPLLLNYGLTCFASLKRGSSHSLMGNWGSKLDFTVKSFGGNTM